jgi:N-acetylmuramoyl-L-alanine amidase
MQEALLASHSLLPVSFRDMKLRCSQKSIFLFCFVALLASHYALASQREPAGAGVVKPVAEKDRRAESVQATVRIGKHPDFVRIVFILDERYVEKAVVTQKNATTLEVEFPLAVALTEAEKGDLPPGTPVEVVNGVTITPGGKKSVIVLQQISSFKVHRFSEPSRLAIDALAVPSVKEPSPEKAAPGVSEGATLDFKTVMIDAGHGGYDKGIRGKDFHESDMVLSFAKDLASALGKKGKRVFFTRKSDHVLPIRERVHLVRQRSPDILLSLHVAMGHEVVVYTASRKLLNVTQREWVEEGAYPQSDNEKAVAQALAQSILSSHDLPVSHVRLPLSLLAQTPAVAVLIELPHPETFSYDGKNRERLISAIVRGISHVQISP